MQKGINSPTPCWALLRGLARESAHWDLFPDQLCSIVPGADIHPLDLPGTGSRWRELSPFNVHDMMESTRSELLQRAGRPVAGRLVLIGISLGGMVAIDWALSHPEDIAGLVLINTSVGGLSSSYRRLDWRVIPELLSIVATRDISRREAGILRLTCNLRPLARELIESRVAIARARPISGRTVLRQLWAAARFHPFLTRPRFPVLLLIGSGDRMVSPRCTLDLARAWQVEPRIHPWAGHDLPVDDPAWTLEAIRDWQFELPTC